MLWLTVIGVCIGVFDISLFFGWVLGYDWGWLVLFWLNRLLGMTSAWLFLIIISKRMICIIVFLSLIWFSNWKIRLMIETQKFQECNCRLLELNFLQFPVFIWLTDCFQYFPFQLLNRQNFASSFSYSVGENYLRIIATFPSQVYLTLHRNVY